MRHALFFLMLFSQFSSFGQLNTQIEEKIESRRIWNIELKGNYEIPFADMANRFGNNFRLGGGAKIKTANNWMLGVELQFIVGGKVKEEGLLQNVKTSRGDIINQYGEPIQPGIFQRGYITGLKAGKILQYKQPNPNSGFTIETGVGFMQHKINLFDRDNNLPQIKGEYKKGYDRLTNGIYLKQFVGYTYYSSSRLVNFVTGIEALYGFTQGRRDYWYDVSKAGTEKRNDIMIGVSFAWLIPIYKKITEETYY